MKINIVDFIPSSESDLQNLLKRKFEKQQEGKLKWLEAKKVQMRNEDFLPIEFAKDKECVLYRLDHFTDVFFKRDLCEELKQDLDIKISFFDFNGVSDIETIRNYIDSLDEINESAIRLFIVLMKRTSKVEQYARAKRLFPKLFSWILNDFTISQRVIESAKKERKLMQRSGWKFFVNDAPMVRENKELMKKLLSICLSVYSCLTIEELQDKEIILSRKSTIDIGGIPLDYWNDRKFVIDVIRSLSSSSNILSLIPDLYYNDKEIMLEIVKRGGGNYIFINTELKNDREIVLAAVTSTPSVYSSIPDEFKTREFILEAITLNPQVIRYSDELLDRDHIKNLIETYCATHKIFLPQPYLSDMELLRLIIKKNPHQAYMSLPTITRDQVLELVKINGRVLPYTISGLHCLDYTEDAEIVLEAIKQDGYALASLYSEEQVTNQMISEAIKSSGYFKGKFKESYYRLRIETAYSGAKVNSSSKDILDCFSSI